MSGEPQTVGLRPTAKISRPFGPAGYRPAEAECRQPLPALSLIEGPAGFSSAPQPRPAGEVLHVPGANTGAYAGFGRTPCLFLLKVKFFRVHDPMSANLPPGCSGLRPH